MGGFHPVESLGEETAIYIRHPEVSRLLTEYWNILWTNAIPLKEGTRIHFERLEDIAQEVGISYDEYEKLIKPLRAEVA